MGLKVYYAAGPGDVVTTFRHWLKGEDDPSQYGVTYSSQFFDFMKKNLGEALVVSSNSRRDQESAGTISVINRPHAGAGGAGYWRGQLMEGFRLFYDLLKHRPDFAVVAEGTAPWLFVIPARLFGIKVIPALHCVLWPLTKKPNRFLKKLDQLAFCLAIRDCLCASQEIIEQVRGLAGDTVKCHLFYPTYRAGQFATYTEADWSSKPKRLLYLGRIEKDKGVFDLLEAFTRIENQRPGEFVLDFCGKGSALNSLRDSAKAMGLDDRVVFHGHCQREKLENQIALSHMIVVPTTSEFVEGFNQVVAEGVLARRHVIATSVCPAAGIFGDAVAVVPPDDPGALAEAILSVAETPGKISSTGESEKLLTREMSWGAGLEEVVEKTSLSGSLIGYLVPQFPSQTHAFFWREMVAMRETGARIQLLSTRPPLGEECKHDFAETARKETVYLSDISWRAVARIMTRPISTWKAFHYVLGLSETPMAKRLRAISFIPCAAQLAVVSDRIGMGHVHLHSCADAGHIGALSRFFGGPEYSLTLHGDLKVYGTDHQRKFAGARWVSTVTRPLQKQVVEKAGLSKEKVPVICMGVDVEKFTPADRVSGGPLHLVTVARLIPQKGHLHALEAMARVRAGGIQIRYSIAGSGPFGEEIQKRIDELGLSDCVAMTGSISEGEVRKLLDEADVFLLPSYGLGEAAPVSVMEAMACGLPVICSRIGGTEDMIHHLKDGWLVHQQNEDELVEAIVKFASDPAYRETIGAAARQSALRYFCHRKNAGALLACIRGDHAAIGNASKSADVVLAG